MFSKRGSSYLWPLTLIVVGGSLLLLPAAEGSPARSSIRPSIRSAPIAVRERIHGRLTDAIQRVLTSGSSQGASGAVVLAAATPAASPSPHLDPAKRGAGAAIVYVVVLLVFGALYLFTRDRLRRT
jgi:hypothetical protein